MVSGIAVAGNAQQNVSITVTVLAAIPCTFNNGNDVAVDFGNNVITTQVDGNNYRQVVPYNLLCTGLANNALRLQFDGVGAGFDPGVLATNNPSLGIRLLDAGGAQIAPKSWVNFTYPLTPLIRAVPVKQAGSTLTGGTFSGAATLVIDYQ
ncbi:fimbrial protein [Serratia fonticola]|nr:fimbrial protein [Serratia fonticola]